MAVLCALLADAVLVANSARNAEERLFVGPPFTARLLDGAVALDRLNGRNGNYAGRNLAQRLSVSEPALARRLTGEEQTDVVARVALHCAESANRHIAVVADVENLLIFRDFRNQIGAAEAVVRWTHVAFAFGEELAVAYGGDSADVDELMALVAALGAGGADAELVGL